SMIGERDRTFVVESQRGERLDRVEDQLLGLRELAALHRADSLRLREQRASARMAGALGDGRDPVEERLIVDPPPRRGEHAERTDEGEVDESLGITGASYRVVAGFALAESVDGREEVARRDLHRRGLGLHQLFAEGLPLDRK